MRRDLFILGLVCALTFFAGLGRAAISDSDEAFYAEAAREMVESGDWLTPRYNYEDRFQKPILYYWLAAAAFEMVGPSEAAARFPAACSGLALCLICYAAGRRWFGPRAGLIAGLVAATSFGYVFLGRLALPDLPLAAFMTLATWAALEAIRAARNAEPRARWWLIVAAGASGLAMLTKGPVGVVLPALVALAALAVGRSRGSRLVPFALIDLAVATAVFVGVAAPWYVAMGRHHGIEYLWRFFVGENVERFATDRYNDPRSIWFYVPVLLGGLLPWSVYLAHSGPRAWRLVTRRTTASTLEWWLMLWAAIPFLFYTASIGKQPRYILPVLPPLALLLGRSLARRLDDAASRTALAWSTSVVGIVSFLLGWTIWRADSLLAGLPAESAQAAAIIVSGAGAALLATAWRAPAVRLPAAVAVTAVITLVALNYTVFSVSGPEPVEQLARVAREHRAAVVSSGTSRAFVRNFVFYTGMQQTSLDNDADLATFLQSDQVVLCVIPLEDLERVEHDFGLKTVRLAEARYFNPAGVRLGTLVRPDPARDLHTVVLVRNRQ